MYINWTKFFNTVMAAVAGMSAVAYDMPIVSGILAFGVLAFSFANASEPHEYEIGKHPRHNIATPTKYSQGK